MHAREKNGLDRCKPNALTVALTVDTFLHRWIERLHMGRPTKYSEKLMERMCDTIAGGMSVSRMCKNDWAPERQTFYNWLMQYPAFFDRYIHARETQSHCLIDEIADIADDMEDEPNSRRIRIEARRIYAEKCAPTKYSPKQQIETDQKIEISITSFAGASNENKPPE